MIPKPIQNTDILVVDDEISNLKLLSELLEDRRVLTGSLDFGDAPGSLRVVEDEAIPAFVAGRKVSLHQAGLQDVIACAKLLGDCAEHMLLVGVQPVELEDYGGSLRPPVRAQIRAALAVARDYLENHGVTLQENSAAVDQGVITPGLDIGNYEAGRPGPSAACREGDARVLERARGQH